MKMYDIEVFENKKGDIAIKQCDNTNCEADNIIIITKEQADLFCTWIEEAAKHSDS
ncbi:MAG: hypothetical protein COA63_001000 [Methylophaga sp.]|nr:hypothetical protein [Methylophaga sp.]